MQPRLEPGLFKPRKSASSPFPSRTEGQRPLSRRAGFALLITVTLLAFLVLLLVSLASLTRVETVVAANHRQSGLARQNALMALNIALGQLQTYTGPDQRTTARADMASAWSNTTVANGRWLGAYGNGAVIDTNYTAKPSAIPSPITTASDSKGSQAKLINWLVSGNERTAFDPDTNVAADGRITTVPPSFAYKPDSAINLNTAAAAPAAADSQALLVGPGSASAVADRVSAPLVSIKIPADKLPGLTGSNDVPVGRYAWWVGDEGAKARINLPMAGASQAPAAFVTSQRTAVEWVDKINPVGTTAPFASTQLIGSDYDPTRDTVTKIVQPRQLPLFATSSATALDTAARLRFHDLTGQSSSVLADAYAGGLKKDLSAVLAKNASSPADADFIFPADGSNTFGVPTWGLLRSFARTTAPAGGVDPQLPTTTQNGIYPVLTYAALGMQYAAPDGDAQGNRIRLALFPLVVLWNPYTTAIKTAKYEIGFNKKGPSPFQLQVEKSGTATKWTVKETLDLNRGLAAITGGDANPDGSANETSTTTGTYEAGAPAADSYVRFIIDTPDGIPAGASLIFTLQGAESGKDYDAAFTGAAKNTLTPGFGIGYVLVNKGAVIGTGESGRNFRVGINYNASFPTDRTLYSPAPAQFASMSGGEAGVYLGKPGSAIRSGYLSSDANDKEWYQAITRTSPAQDSATGGNLLNGRNKLLQAEAPLTVVSGPTSVLSFYKIFNSETKTVRWLAQGNPRASMVTRTAGNLVVLNQGGGLGMETPWQKFTAGSSGKRASAGPSLNAASAVVDAALFEFRPADQPLLSIGQLQHADLARIHSYPAYAIGNSLGDFHFKDNRDKVWLDQTALLATGGVNPPTTSITSYYDLSWLINRALWDRYFVSTVPHAGTGTAANTDADDIPRPLANPRLERYGDPSATLLRDAGKAASGLMLSGGFNINSTSEQAWRAVLAGINQLAYNPVTGSTSAPALKAALPRFAKPTAPPAVGTDQAWAWQGYRQLSDEQIATLAANIVSQIRNRGPFVSLADFVNRRLVDNSATTGVHENEQFKGAIQAAIDITYSGSSAANSGDAAAYGASGSNPFGATTAPTYSTETTLFDADLLKGYAGTASGSVAAGSISAFAPQFLTQADVLSAIGPGLSARSDTFLIRTYGEVVNPITQEIEGRAWCEAVVQRMPGYVDPTLNPEDIPAAGTVNRRLGRRYGIVSFRWLSKDDI